MIGREGHKKALYGKLGGRLAFPYNAKDEKFYDPTLFRWEPYEALFLLAYAYPDIDFIVTSAHDGSPNELPNVFSAQDTFGTKRLIDTEPYLSELIDTHQVDHFINWVGVNAVSQSVPKLDGSGPVKPLTSDQYNTAPLVRLINQWRETTRPSNCETWLWPDARYALKVRDLKWPITKPVVGQMDTVFNMKLHRYGDEVGPEEYGYSSPWNVKWATGKRQTPNTDWHQGVEYKYSGLETLAACRMPIAPRTLANRSTRCVLIANEVKRAPMRYDLMDNLPSNVDVFGEWESRPEIARVDNDALNALLSTYRVGILPTLIKGKGMATLKYWEYIRAGVVPIAAPGYDEQQHLNIRYRAQRYSDLPGLIEAALEFSNTLGASIWLRNQNDRLNQVASSCLAEIMSEPTSQRSFA